MIDKAETKYVVLIIYDIINDKQRLKIAKYLDKFCNRVQKSAFEGNLTKKQYNKLTEGLKKIVHKDDNIRIYRLYGDRDIEIYGNTDYQNYEDVIII